MAVAGLEAEFVAATANLLLATTAAATEEDELIRVLRVVAAAEELVFGVLGMLLEAEKPALEPAFVLKVGIVLEAKLVLGVLEMLLEAKAALKLA